MGPSEPLERGHRGGGWWWRVARSPDGCVPASRSHGGRWLAREPAGFPGIWVLRGLGADGAAALRLLKACALAGAAILREGEHGELSGGRVRVIADSDRPPQGSWIAARGGDRSLDLTVGERWVRAHASAGALRRSLRSSLPAPRASVPELEGGITAGEAPPPGRDTGAPPRASSAPATPQVLLFRNLFSKDVDRGDASQFNPGSHALYSALRDAGVEVRLLDAKIPLQDVCVRPADPVAEVPLDVALTDAEELRAALATDDVDLVCVTLLERCFAEARAICKAVRRAGGAWIAVGGAMPTAAPEQVWAHLPEADLLLRGDGERDVAALARIAAGARRRGQGLDDAAIAALATLEGVVARDEHTTVAARLERAVRVGDLDARRLRFDALDEVHVRHGLSLSTSRGCVYACRFCTVADRQLWRGSSADHVMATLADYEARLVAIYGAPEAVPATARQLQIWDDDFFLDRGRAAALLPRIAAAGFTTTFVQGTVASFFARGPGAERTLDEALLDAIPPALFTEVGGLKIGTENVADAELRRLGKPYRAADVRGLVAALARRGLPQDHYLILCNRETSLDDLLDNLETYAELRCLVGPSYRVLQPSWLIRLFPTQLYRSAVRRDEEHQLPTAGALRRAGYLEYDYPFVLPQRPRRREVFEIVRRFPAGMHFGAAGDPGDPMEGVHAEADPAYLRVFAAIRALLSRRLEAIDGDPGVDAAAERVRIRRALDGRLRTLPAAPAGVLARLAPGLRGQLGAAGEVGLAGYLRALLDAADDPALEGATVAAEPGGATLRLPALGIPLELGVERQRDGVASAFHSENLAFVVRSTLDDDPAREAAGAAIDAVRRSLAPLDRGTLE